jgi:hypothetical protein
MDQVIIKSDIINPKWTAQQLELLNKRKAELQTEIGKKDKGA